MINVSKNISDEIIPRKSSKLSEIITTKEYDKRFQGIDDLDKIFCDYRLIQRNLAKYYLEELFDEDLDNEEEVKHLLNIFGNDFYGGIDWINYAFSDKYKEEHNPQNARLKDSEMQDKKYVNMSLFEVLEIWGLGNLGEFIVPDEFKSYVMDSWNKGEIDYGDMPEDEELFEGAREVVEELVNVHEMPCQSAIALIGAMWTECGWKFDKSVVNRQELSGGGLSGTEGYANCGECWCQITFWKTKLDIIKRTNAPVPRTESEYNKESATHLSDLGWDWQVKLVYEFIKKQKLWGKILLDPDGDPGEQIVASYIQKAGFGKKPTLEEADRTAKIYMKSHAEVNGSKKPINGFAKQIFASIKFSGYIANLESGMSGQDAVPTDDDVLATLL